VGTIPPAAGSTAAGKTNHPANSSLFPSGTEKIFIKILFYKFTMRNRPKMQVLTSGIFTPYGANFTSLIIAYKLMWFDKKN
jgi:hypothetical protein